MINGNALLPGTETASVPYFLLMKRGTMPRQARDKREVNSKKERFVSFRFTFHVSEDLTSVIAKFSNALHGDLSGGPGEGAPGLWGTPLGAKLRAWMAAHQRPLIWSDRIDGPMLLDPAVAAAIPGFSQRAQVRKKPRPLLFFRSNFEIYRQLTTTSSARP